MDRLFTISAIVFVIGFNYFVLSTENINILVPLFVAVYLCSMYLVGLKALRRLRFFVTLFVFLFIFQLIFQASKDLELRFFASLTTVLQIATMSEMINIITRKISISRFIGGLFFLPKSAKLLVTITFSFIPFLFEEQQKISYVQKSRGIKTNFFGSFFTVIPLVHRVMQRSQDLALSINMKGYEN